MESGHRILELLTTLSPHYTKECTRNAQPLYKEQALERYSSLIGHLPPARSSWLDSVGFGGAEGDYLPPSARSGNPDNHKYFFAINLYNSFDVIPDLFATLFRAASVLGYQNVFVSIYEIDGPDEGPPARHDTRGAFNHRIEYLAEVRNASFVPLHELRNAENEYFDTIVFMNDILPCVDDLL
ncbi:hypothetical protein EUX98_g9108 [Antrodiella citrinella]|uniref:Glycosyltransferase family 69 protein n=1 Tax=Antrodiella citrinella TaxID=2447956 RepID=A0A4S4LY95_9APHY|nr:hypothetical protein EUX98_g9108 [Antrodiella citrinella]